MILARELTARERESECLFSERKLLAETLSDLAKKLYDIVLIALEAFTDQVTFVR